MQIDTLRNYLDHPSAATEWLRSLGLEEFERGHGNLVCIASAGVTLDLLATICDQLAEHLPRLSDPDRALNNLERFITAARSPLALASLFDRDREALPVLLQIFSTSQYLSDFLVTDHESYDLLRLTEGQPVARDMLVDELVSEVESLPDQATVMAALRRFKHREILRIAYGDIVRDQSLDTVTRQISYVADAILEATVRVVRKKLQQQRGVPSMPDGSPTRFVVLALGKLGGIELNYSSDIDLIFLHDGDGSTMSDQHQSHFEFFDRLGGEVIRMLTESTPLGCLYRVDMRLRPEGKHGPMVASLQGAKRYYDVMGRTWERQALVKARAVAGDLDLGEEFLRYLESWIYRRYLNLADITGIKALKRRIEQRTQREGTDELDVKTGHGGIRDIEFVIQFLQLLNGGDLPKLRTGNTLEAIANLESVGCLTPQERSLLEENYCFLRKIEHRLQIMFDVQTHRLPQDTQELRKVAIRMGYASKGQKTALELFQSDYKNRTALNRKILDHLLHDAFGEEVATQPEVDLVLDPNPPENQITEVLSRYRFKDVSGAYDNLIALSKEKIRFLSERRCRHFLAAIAPKLLQAIAKTPDPDSTLVNLSQVSDSLGGKGVLWELFSFHPPSLHLVVELCASSPLLSGILTSNPGMIDELLDSLLLDKLPTLESLDAMLADLCRGAEDLEPILHSFKNSQQLRVGIRDILRKDDIQATNAALADIAQACLKQILLSEYEKLTVKFGQPTLGEGPRSGKPCEAIIVAMGKFGGREPNYHSDLDLIFLYEADGSTVHVGRSDRNNTTSNQHFFGELGQRIIKIATRPGPYGRLYEVDLRLRPTGRSGALATPLKRFARYFREGQAQLWERMALCKARVVFGSPEVAETTMNVIHEAAYGLGWRGEYAQEIRHMRARLEETASVRNLKRGSGGMVDVEFFVQMLQLMHGRQNPSIRVPGTLHALAALHEEGHLTAEDFEFFSDSYRFLRNVEARLRLMNTTARHDLPEDEQELGKLARLLGYSEAAGLLSDCDNYRSEIRNRFDRQFTVVSK